jgi:hypothetical protein
MEITIFKLKIDNVSRVHTHKYKPKGKGWRFDDIFAKLKGHQLYIIFGNHSTY